jgi:AcrR family transcriptional regulator
VSLTNQLVEQAARGPVRRGRTPDSSRDRLIAAAAREFAARGFAGANVDRIATAAGVNKAMIYYHFHSKADLYRHILRDMFSTVGTRVRAVADSDRTPEDKIRQFVEAIAAEAEARPHFPPIWLRELAEGGSHLDRATVGDITGILKALAAIVDEGIRAGRFQPINPFLLQAGIVAPLLLFFATARVRQRVGRAGAPEAARLTPRDVVAHVQRFTLGLLEGRT